MGHPPFTLPLRDLPVSLTIARMSIADDAQVARLIEAARHEDLGQGDLSTGLLPNLSEPATFRLVAKQRGVFAGREIAPAVLRAYDEAIEVEWTGLGTDGATIEEVPVELATLRGPLGTILSAERVLLNFLQRLCGVATLTRTFVEAVASTDAAIYDTRKTTPGWRALEKYAVRSGGGRNHRMGLYDAVLIKDNHLAGVDPPRLAAHVFDMLNRLAAGEVKPALIEVEVDRLEQVEKLFGVVGIDVILLDNFTLEEMRAAVAMRDGLGLRGKVALEASGGVTLGTVRSVADTGVDRIAVGALTHSAVAIDLSLERA